MKITKEIKLKQSIRHAEVWFSIKILKIHNLYKMEKLYEIEESFGSLTQNQITKIKSASKHVNSFEVEMDVIEIIDNNLMLHKMKSWENRKESFYKFSRQCVLEKEN